MLVRYLLGALTAEEENRIEEQFFADDEFFEELLVVEDALMDAYVQGELDEDERAEFKNYITSSPQKLSDLGFTRGLLEDAASMRDAVKYKEKIIARRSLVPTHFLQRFPIYALTAFLVLCGLCAYLIFLTSDLRGKVDRLGGEVSALQDARRQPGNGGSTYPSNIVATLELSMTNASRGAGAMPTVELSQEAQQLRIITGVGNDPRQQGYLVTVSTPEGGDVWRGIALSSDQIDPDRLSIFIPAERFKNEVYTLKLERIDRDNQLHYIGEYSFRVKR